MQGEGAPPRPVAAAAHWILSPLSAAALLRYAAWRPLLVTQPDCPTAWAAVQPVQTAPISMGRSSCVSWVAGERVPGIQRNNGGSVREQHFRGARCCALGIAARDRVPPATAARQLRSKNLPPRPRCPSLRWAMAPSGVRSSARHICKSLSRARHPTPRRNDSHSHTRRDKRHSHGPTQRRENTRRELTDILVEEVRHPTQ